MKKYKFLFVCALALSISFPFRGSSQTAGPPPSIQTIRSARPLDASLVAGQGIYITQKAGDRIDDAEHYRYPKFSDAVILDQKGNLYKSKARYNRMNSSIEVFVNRQNKTLDPTYFTEVLFSDDTRYRGVRTTNGNELNWKFIQVVSPDLTDDYLLLKEVVVFRTTQHSPDRGFIDTGNKPSKKDSIYYLTGIKDHFAIQLKKNKKSLSEQLFQAGLSVDKANLNRRALKKNREQELLRVTRLLNQQVTNN